MAAKNSVLGAEDQAALKLLEEEDRKREGIELGKYLQYVKGEVDRETSCLELPMTILLLFSFSCLALLHLRQDKVFAVEGALRFDIEENANFAWSHNFGHKTIYDVNAIADFWSWFQIGFLPLIVQQTWGFSEDLQQAYNSLNATHPYSVGKLPEFYGWPQDELYKKAIPKKAKIPIRDDLLHYNRLVGGIRLRQERAESSYDLCRVPGVIEEDLWKKWLGKPCMPATPNYEMTPEAGDAESFGEAKRIEWFPTVWDSLATLQQKVVDMEDGCQQLDRKGRPGACLCESCSDDGSPTPWLDEQTQRVEVAFVSYNAEYGLMSLTTVTLFFSRGGRIHKFVHVQSSWADHFAGPFFDVVPMVMCDVLWVLLLLYVFINELREIVRVIRNSKDWFWKSIRDDYIDHWNIVDWVSMGLAFFVVQMFLQLFLETGNVMNELEGIAALDLSATGRAQYEARMQDFFTKTEGLCGVERWYRMSFCFYPMAVMMRLFKSFAAQGRLAIVTRTLHDASVDMVHFFIVFFSVYFCMTVNSVLIFGQDIEAYADVERATMTVFRNMFGDWDWSDMQEGSLWISAMWFWAFVLIMMVILLNFLLAILMDSYAVVKEKSSEEATLLKQIDTMMRRRSQNKAKERVKLGYIYETYLSKAGQGGGKGVEKAAYSDEKEMLADKTYTTPADLMGSVEGIKNDQVQRTMKEAKKQNAKEPEPYGLENVKKDLDNVNNRTQLIGDGLFRMKNRISKYDNGINFDHKTSSQQLDRPVPPRTQIVQAVRNEISKLGTDISGVLGEEVSTYSEQHRELEQYNRNMLACMTDTHRVMQSIRAQTEATRQATQRQSLLAQRKAHAVQRAIEAQKEARSCAPCLGTAPATVARTTASPPG